MGLHQKQKKQINEISEHIKHHNLDVWCTIEDSLDDIVFISRNELYGQQAVIYVYCRALQSIKTL